MIGSMDKTPRMHWGAVCVGAIVDQGGSIVMSLIVAFVSSLLSVAQTHGATQRAPSADAAGQLVYEILSISFVVLGGLVAARIAKTLMVLHGFAVSVASLIGAQILGALVGADFGDPPRAIFFGLLTLGAGPLGGAIGLLFGTPKPLGPAPAAHVPQTPAAATASSAPAGLWVDLRPANPNHRSPDC
jgi:putative membrane protein (TIGR04086 family)